MKIGYINFGAEEKNNLYKVIQSIRDHHAIDELGIGRIRDAFSNKMFPGMSVLQGRAKYFVLLPALYLEAEKAHYKTVEEVRRKVLDMEIKLTRQLLNGTPRPEDQLSITGSSMIDKAEKNSSQYVKYDPSYIYWGGLVTYGFVKTNGSVYRLIFERSLARHNSPQKYYRDEESEITDSTDLSGTIQLFDTGGLKYIFDGKTPINIFLTKEEAEFLKRRIELSENSKDSLLAYLLNNDIPLVDNFQELRQVLNELPESYLYTYSLSARFSRYIYLLRIFYNYLYDKRTATEELANSQLQDYLDYYNEHKAEFTEIAMAEILKYVDEDVSDMAVKKFCLQTAKCVDEGDLETLEELIISREKATKGWSRAKLTNWEKYTGIPHTSAFFLDYRWSLVYKMINEIKRGLEYGS